MADGKVEKYIVDGREQNRVVWRDSFSYFRWETTKRTIQTNVHINKNGQTRRLQHYDMGVPIHWIKTIMDRLFGSSSRTTTTSTQAKKLRSGLRL